MYIYFYQSTSFFLSLCSTGFEIKVQSVAILFIACDLLWIFCLCIDVLALDLLCRRYMCAPFTIIRPKSDRSTKELHINGVIVAIASTGTAYPSNQYEYVWLFPSFFLTLSLSQHLCLGHYDQLFNDDRIEEKTNNKNKIHTLTPFRKPKPNTDLMCTKTHADYKTASNSIQGNLEMKFFKKKKECIMCITKTKTQKKINEYELYIMSHTQEVNRQCTTMKKNGRRIVGHRIEE